MTSRGNLNTLRSLFSWNSTWYSKNSYKKLLFRDLVIELYLSSLFYKLKIASSYFLIKSTFFDFNIIETELYLFSKRRLLFLYFESKCFFSATHCIIWLLNKYGNNEFSCLSTETEIDKSIFLNEKRMILLYLLCNKDTFYSVENLIFCFYNLSGCIDILFNLKLYFLKKIFFLESKQQIALKISFFYVCSNKHNFFFNQFFSSILHLEEDINLTNFFFYNWDIFFLLYTSSNKYNNMRFIFYFQKRYSISLENFLLLNKDVLYLLSNNDWSGKHVWFKIWFMLRYLLIYIENTKLIFFNPIFMIRNYDIANKLKLIITFLRIFLKNKIPSFRYIWNNSSFLFSILNTNEAEYSNKIIENLLFEEYYFNIIDLFSYKIEKTLLLYTGSSYYFFPTVYLETKPFITNSKIVCEFIVFYLEKGSSINHVWKTLKWWIINQFNFLNKLTTGKLPIGVVRCPLKGIRIICKGSNYAARRKRKFAFHSWVSDEIITGRMPSQSFSVQLDFFQSSLILKSATIGVKVWTLFDFI